MAALSISDLLVVLATIFSGIILLTLWIWRHTTSLDDQDEERIRELENNQESAYKAELADLYLSIENYIEESRPRPDDMGRDEHIVNVLERKIEESDLDSVVKELDDIGSAEELWDSHRRCYKESYRYFGRAAASILVLIATLVIVGLFRSDPFKAVFMMPYALISFLFLSFSWDGVKLFKRARRKKEMFEDRWREYKRLE